jgi:hypothetical protein
LDSFEIVEFPIKMPRKQQNGVFQLALAVVQGPLAKFQNGDGGTDDNGRDQEDATKDEPIERIAPIERRSDTMADTVPSGTSLPHWASPWRA